MNRKTAISIGTRIVLGLACASAQAFAKSETPSLVTEVVEHAYRSDDDLLTAGLGAAGLRSPVPPAFADATQPTAVERRRRAIWANWRGIADLSAGGGYGELYGALSAVPGREYHAMAKLPGAGQPHRVMVQLPDTYDVGKRCLVVTASSGSRGIYGAIALAGAWGLSHGCAVAYTDKGNGTGFVDTASGQGTRLDGSPAGAADIAEFTAGRLTGEGVAPIAVKHAHSADNPEADWGRHVQQAAQFGLQVLQAAHPEAGPHSFANTRVIAVGVSNGGGAVLRAAELDGAWLDGVVAVSPNIHVPDRGRALFDYATDAAVWMPCALNAPAFDRVALARPGGAKSAAGQVRCASLQTAGLLVADTVDAQAEQAHQHLLAGGWTDAAIAAGAISSGFDLWRAVAVTYASAYARADASTMPCGYRFNAVDAKGIARAPSAVERAAWWSDSAGIPPGAGVAIVDGLAAGSDPSLPGLNCLRGLLSGTDATARAVGKGLMQTRASLPRKKLPVLVIHGADDGLVPAAFSGAAYTRWAKAAGRDVRYWRVANAQHFDAFLAMPALAATYVPMLPYAYHGLDAMWAQVAGAKPLPGDADIATQPRALVGTTLAPLAAGNLGTMP